MHGPPWALVGSLGPCGPGPCGPPWALFGRALVGPLGPCGLGPFGPSGPLCALLGPCGPCPCGPPWALAGRALAGPPRPSWASSSVYIYSVYGIPVPLGQLPEHCLSGAWPYVCIYVDMCIYYSSDTCSFVLGPRLVPQRESRNVVFAHAYAYASASASASAADAASASASA